jgi:hypothetical protein
MVDAVQAPREARKFKVFNHQTFVAACALGERRGYNRQIPAEAAAKMPTDRLYPVMFSMLHEHIAGKAATPHVRCVIGLCSSGGTCVLDVDADVFAALPEIEA